MKDAERTYDTMLAREEQRVELEKADEFGRPRDEAYEVAKQATTRRTIPPRLTGFQVYAYA